MIGKDKIKLLAFDADDTLWDCQSHFDAAEKEYQNILSDYGTPAEVSSELFKTVMAARLSCFRLSRMRFR